MLSRLSSPELTEWNAYYTILAEEAEMEAAGTPETNPGAWEQI